MEPNMTNKQLSALVEDLTQRINSQRLSSYEIMLVCIALIEKSAMQLFGKKGVECRKEICSVLDKYTKEAIDADEE
jgi:hypothetical protein